MKPFGDDPRGYLVYTPDDHVFAQLTTRAQREWPRPEVLKLPGPQLLAVTGFVAYCGTFEVHDGQVLHHREFGVFPSMSGTVEPRSVEALDGDRLILGTPRGGCVEWERVHTERKDSASDSELRQRVLGIWRLVGFQQRVDGTVVMPFGDNPQGYLVYTPDDHVFVQFATRAQRNWRGPEVEGEEMTVGQAIFALGFFEYCGTFEVGDSHVVHRVEFGFVPSMTGAGLTRSVMLDGDRLVLRAQSDAQPQLEWQRVHSCGRSDSADRAW
jgi:hypothetical protein